MSYRLSILRMQLSNLKATVTNESCTIISNFNFDPLCVELGPYGSFFDEKKKTKQKTNKLKEQLPCAQLIGL